MSYPFNKKIFVLFLCYCRNYTYAMIYDRFGIGDATLARWKKEIPEGLLRNIYDALQEEKRKNRKLTEALEAKENEIDLLMTIITSKKD